MARLNWFAACTPGFSSSAVTMPNRTFPEEWKYRPELCALRRDPRLFFYLLAQSVDDYWRCFVGPSPMRPEFLRSTCYPLDRDVRTADVSRWLHELKSAGIVVVSDSERGWYVEIVESFRYHRDDYSQKQPKYGPRHKPPPEQPTLPLGPLSAVEPPTQALRSRVDHGLANESPRATPPTRKTRPASAGSDSLRFARSADDHDDPVWQDLCRVLAPNELTIMGAEWDRRWRLDRTGLGSLVRQWLDIDPTKRGNAAAYLTSEWYRIHPEDRKRA